MGTEDEPGSTQGVEQTAQSLVDRLHDLQVRFDTTPGQLQLDEIARKVTTGSLTGDASSRALEAIELVVNPVQGG